MRVGRVRAAALPGAALGLFASTLAFAPSALAGPAPVPSERPNVVVVMTDDQTATQLRRAVMPATVGALADRGTSFTSAFVSSPLCCPSRAGFLTGSYPHNNGVFDNTPGYSALAENQSTLFTWLDAHGYRTGHVGRYLLGYRHEPASANGTINPPGVDDWFGYVDDQTFYYNGAFADNGFAARAGFGPEGHSTAVINREAREFIDESSAAGDPFFLWVAHLAPHTTNSKQVEACGGGTPIPESGAFASFAKERLPRRPSFNEKRISDKPRWVRNRGRLSPEKLALLRRGWRCALASLAGVDRGVGEIVAELARLGELDNTAIFFTSDNGLLFGEHRLVQQKGYPYDEAARVPLLARLPDALTGGSQPAEISAPVTNLDLTATILELTGTPPCAAAGCHSIDGRSLMPLLRGERPAKAWPKRRGVLAEIGNHDCSVEPGPGQGMSNFYDAIRTTRFLYVELHHVDPLTGTCDRREWELYNRKRDPFELDNLAVNPKHRKPPPAQRRLAARLEALRTCAGIAERDTALPGRAFCE